MEKNSIFFHWILIVLECITEGCVPPALYRTRTEFSVGRDLSWGGGLCPGVSLSGGAMSRGVSVRGGKSLWPPSPLWTEWLTDRCKNITFPQLPLRVVMNMNWYQYECLPLVKEETWTETEFVQDPPQSNLLVLLSCVHVCFRREQCALYSSKFYDVVEVVRGEENVCGAFCALCSLFCDGRGRYYTRRNTENARDIRWVTRNLKIFQTIDLILIKEGFSASENQSRFYGWRCLQSNLTLNMLNLLLYNIYRLK